MDDVHMHGMVIDRKNQRVRCKYCNKDMRGITRLKYHLACIRGDVAPCQEVPLDVKAQMGILIREGRQRLKNKSGKFESSRLLRGRNNSTKSIRAFPVPCKDSQAAETMEQKVVNLSPKVMMEKFYDNDTVTESSSFCRRKSEDDSWRHACLCIGKFFYDSGIDFSEANSPYFKSMIDAIVACGSGHAPTPSDLRGWILHEELKTINQRLEDAKSSWETTGCSILLDSWTDNGGRDLLCFIVDCPKVTILLKYIDASDHIKEDELVKTFNGVIEKVGIQNVVQVVTCNTTDYMEVVRERLMEEQKNLFWTHCAVYCIDLMIEEIGIMINMKEVLHNAKLITKFVNSNIQILALMKKHISGRELVCPAKTRSVTDILTLQNIVSEKENLRNMFNSTSWKASTWSSTTIGKEVADLIWKPSFWTSGEEVLKVMIPLIRVLRLAYGDEKRPMGYIYEAMDRAKETIQIDLNYDEAKYLPIWTVVDRIWNNLLHNPLHSAGYYLNPGYFYSDDFFGDAEVAAGLLDCVECLVKDLKVQNLLHLQLDDYRNVKGGFSTQQAIEGRTKFHPVEWWSLYGGHCPELQRFAMRILSQTCSGMRCRQDRGLLERLCTKEKSKIENSLLEDLVLVHCNLQMQRPLSITEDHMDSLLLEKNDWVSDWIMAANRSPKLDCKMNGFGP
ncbi:unnamed protein product [Victoria cruziana]